MFPRESVADEDEESVPGQTVYADFDYAVCFLIGGRLMLDYDENMALLKAGKSPSNTVQNSALQSPWTSRHPSASMQV